MLAPVSHVTSVFRFPNRSFRAIGPTDYAPARLNKYLLTIKKEIHQRTGHEQSVGILERPTIAGLHQVVPLIWKISCLSQAPFVHSRPANWSIIRNLVQNYALVFADNPATLRQRQQCMTEIKIGLTGLSADR